MTGADKDLPEGLSPLARRVHQDLLAVRKTNEGWTAATAALYPTICTVLGGGDPHLAFSALRIAVLNLIDSPGVLAAAASLGLTTDLPTHTDRLNDAGADLGLGERQVRRLSDLGLLALARYITTNWNQSTVPVLRATVVRTSDQSFDVMISTRRHLNVEMSAPVLSIDDSTRAGVFTESIQSEVVLMHLSAPIVAHGTEFSLHVQWRGELWPRFILNIGALGSTCTVNVLGNSMRVVVGP